MHGEKYKNNHHVFYWVIAVLLILLIGSVSYILIGKYNERKEAEKNELITEGILLGQRNTILEIMNRANTCTPVSLTFENVTMNLFALECQNLGEVATAVLQERMAQNTPNTSTQIVE